jgi:hypothetical protein
MGVRLLLCVPWGRDHEAAGLSRLVTLTAWRGAGRTAGQSVLVASGVTGVLAGDGAGVCL